MTPSFPTAITISWFEETPNMVRSVNKRETVAQFLPSFENTIIPFSPTATYPLPVQQTSLNNSLQPVLYFCQDLPSEDNRTMPLSPTAINSFPDHVIDSIIALYGQGDSVHSVVFVDVAYAFHPAAMISEGDAAISQKVSLSSTL